MCGIIGCVGKRPAAALLLDGLHALEYRGYDSAGIAVMDGETVSVVKTKGRVDRLEEKLREHPLQGTMGIGHTRWATHGEPSDVNSHPHTSMAGDIALVHNGIIENYLEIKRWLMDRGYRFASDTDTEVVAHLVSHYDQGDLVRALHLAMTRLRGSYALAVMSVREPDRIVCARKDSPLVIGLGEGENFIASDIPALLTHTREVILLEDGDVAVVTRERVHVVDANLDPVELQPFHVDWDVSAAEKGGYAHFMLKEMMEQPQAIRETVSPRVRDGHIALSEITEEALSAARRVVICACGTAYHAGLVGKYIMEDLARIPVEVDIGSEYRYRRPIIHGDDLCIVISQSGETADTIAALRTMKEGGARVLAITNVVGSTVAREADSVLYTWAGPEIAVASTKAYTTQLAALVLLALELGRVRGTVEEAAYREILTALTEVPARIQEVLQDQGAVQRAAGRHFHHRDVFFIGRGLDYPATMASSLKLKEISYIHSEAMAAGELKHGTIAMIEEGTLVIAVCTQDVLLEKMVSAIREVKARGAHVLAVTYKDCSAILDQVDEAICIPRTHGALAGMVSVVAAQLFAYYCSVQRGLDPDKPRNLAKSVTVE